MTRLRCAHDTRITKDTVYISGRVPQQIEPVPYGLMDLLDAPASVKDAEPSLALQVLNHREAALHKVPEALPDRLDVVISPAVTSGKEPPL